MLSGEGSYVGKRWKTTIGLISKSNFSCEAHFLCTFLCRFFAQVQRETSRNFLVTRFMEEMSYVYPFTFFHCRSFSPYIGGRQHFSFCHRRYKIFTLFFQQKYVSFVFYLSLSPFFSFELRWPAAHFLISLSFTCSIFQICGQDNLSKLNTLDNTDTESISAFRFRLY